MRSCLAFVALASLAPFAALAAEADVEEVENLLAVPVKPDNPLPASGETGDSSFGAQLDALNLDATWSAYGDVIFRIDEAADGGLGAATFDAYHFNPILSARMGESVRAEIELEFEHGGEEMRVEYALVDLSLARWLTIRAGKFLVPIGHFNDVLHPFFRWVQVSRPAMHRDVIPAVWSEVGLQVFGRAFPSRRVGFEYALYVVNGLGGDLDADWASGAEPFRELRDNVLDNNLDKGLGGRLVVRLLEGAEYGQTQISASGYSGLLDADERRRFSIAAVDIAMSLGPVRVRSELAQNFFESRRSLLRPFEQGCYLQISYNGEAFRPALRWDYQLTRPQLRPPGERIHQLVPSVMYAFGVLWSVRLEGRFPIAVSRAGTKRLPVSVSTMLAFNF